MKKEILNEVYFGETDDIKECLTIIHDFRQKYIYKNNFAMVFPGSNSDPKLMQLSEKLEDMFGFGAIDFNIINAPYMNAFTQPIIYNIGSKPEDHIHSTPTGFKFDKEFNYVTQISYTSNIILNKEFTDREILAVLLHEIGHSFVVVQQDIVPLVQSNRDMIVIQCILAALISLMTLNFKGAIDYTKQMLSSTNGYKLFKAKYNKLVKSSKIGRVYDIIKTGTFTRLGVMLDKAGEILTNLSGLNNILKALSLFMNGWPFMTKKQKGNLGKVLKSQNAYGRSMEYFSDNFAASYGLGADLSTALQKMEFHKTSDFDKTVETISKLNPINLLLGEMVKLPYYEMVNAIDVHPIYANRVSKIEADLKKELAKSKMNPKMKKEIQNSLKELSSLKEEFKKADKIKAQDPNAYRQLWMIAFMDQEESDFLTHDEDVFTSMKERDKFFDKVMKEHSELFEKGDVDLYEFL